MNDNEHITTAFRTEDIAVSRLEANRGQIDGLPKNPRLIRDKRYTKLKESLQADPEFLAHGRLLVFPKGKKYVVIGGNMRLRACKELGWKTLPCDILPEDTPVEKLRRYTILDNQDYGEDDWDTLANEWDVEELKTWGMELPIDWTAPDIHGDGTQPMDTQLGGEPTDNNDEEDEEPAKEKAVILDVLFPTDNDFEIPVLLKEQMGGRVELPITPWGANSRLTVGVNTYHFYVDDYRFEALFRDPANLVASGCKAIVEPNCSLHDQTPIAWGLQLIYKKRWLARYMQELGVKVYADLNVAPKFAEWNRLGIPDGWNAFFTRGLSDMADLMQNDLDLARRISGMDTPNLIVYGGGKQAEKFCQKNGLLYVTDFINGKKIGE